MPNLMLIDLAEVNMKCFYFTARRHGIRWLKWYVTWLVVVPRINPSPYQISCLDVLWKKRRVFPQGNLSQGISWPHDQSLMLLCGWEHLALRHYCAKRVAIRCYGNWEKMFWNFQWEWMIKGICNLVGKLSSN